MARKGLRPKNYSCFTAEQQDCYSKLPIKQRTYVDLRAQGYNKSQAYQLSGYESKKPAQAAYIMESRNAMIAELVDILVKNRKVEQIVDKDSAISKTINAIAQQTSVSQALAKIEDMDAETAQRVKFYRDIINGTIKTVKETKRYNAVGVLIERKIEKVNDVDMKMRARKELDKILGLNQIIPTDQLNVGGITINIVDASKREELEDDRNKVDLSLDDVQVLDGENVIIHEAEEENVPTIEERQSKKDEFYEVVSE